MNIVTVFGLVVSVATVYSKTLAGRRPVSLMNSIQMTLNAIQTFNYATDAPLTTTTAPLPGRMNVCDDLCPKWCEKVAGAGSNNTHCHYVCGNICTEQTISANPYIGDYSYEVVPSTFQFHTYDTNEDKFISKEEFAAKEGVPLDDVNRMFTFTDLNGDGYIDTDEFQSGPFVFTVQMAAELSNMVKMHAYRAQ